MRTARCSGRLSCHACPLLPCMSPRHAPFHISPCHTCPLPCMPPTTHAPHHAPCHAHLHHACPPAMHPLPNMPPPHMPPATHAPPPCMPPLRCTCPGHVWPPMDRMTDMCKNTTFPQTFAGGKHVVMYFMHASWNFWRKGIKKSECILLVKTARASRVTRQALDPGLRLVGFAPIRLTALCRKFFRNFSGVPLDQILDPPMWTWTLTGIRLWISSLTHKFPVLLIKYLTNS